MCEWRSAEFDFPKKLLLKFNVVFGVAEKLLFMNCNTAVVMSATNNKHFFYLIMHSLIIHALMRIYYIFHSLWISIRSFLESIYIIPYRKIYHCNQALRNIWKSSNRTIKFYFVLVNIGLENLNGLSKKTSKTCYLELFKKVLL